jgi:formate dehydrogenase iron-sulfur subunit
MTNIDVIKFVDVTKCMGCRACMVACKNWNDLPAEPEEFNGYQSHEKLTANTWNLVEFSEVESETSPLGYEWLMLHKSCLHCEIAACEISCPKQAISHNSFGAVLTDPDLCTGCGICVKSCGFDVIRIGTKMVNGAEKKISMKCNLCTDRLEAGLLPACVNTCPTGSLTFGMRDEIMSLATERLAVVKERFPNANIYNTEKIGSGGMVYLLADKPEVYQLPDSPELLPRLQRMLAKRNQATS